MVSITTEQQLRRIDAGLVLTGLTALCSMILEYGFLVRSTTLDILRIIDIICVVLFAGLQLTKLIVVKNPREYLRNHRFDFSLLFLVAIQTLVHLGLQSTPEYQYLARHGLPSPLWAFYLGIIQIYLLIIVGSRSHLLHRLLIRLRMRPGQILVSTFLILIGVGTVLLMLPGAGQNGHSVSLVDSLFTATSAVCVTGLVVQDTARQFSTFGTTILLILIQTGGLGILTITASFVLFSRRDLHRVEGKVLTEAMEVETVHELKQTFSRIIIATIVVESVGALLLNYAWIDVIADPVLRGGWAVFHAVSAFCNAGFALFPNNASLTSFTGDPWTNVIIAILIVLGGLGFVVLAELFEKFTSVLRKKPVEPWSRHTKWALTITATLLVTGTLLIYFLERNRLIADLSEPAKLLAAAFQSVTLRTAGFNTISIAHLAPITLVICITLMMIGGCPGSTAGGMKTTTVAVSFSTLFQRVQIDPSIRQRALRIVFLWMGIYGVIVITLGIFQRQHGLQVAFETASALATVGLSMDYTAQLNLGGKLLVCVAMFIGRVGPFTLASALLRSTDTASLPSEKDRILVG